MEGDEEEEAFQKLESDIRVLKEEWKFTTTWEKVIVVLFYSCCICFTGFCIRTFYRTSLYVLNSFFVWSGSTLGLMVMAYIIICLGTVWFNGAECLSVWPGALPFTLYRAAMKNSGEWLLKFGANLDQKFSLTERTLKKKKEVAEQKVQEEKAMKEERIRQAEFEREHQAQMDAENAEATQRIMELEAKRLRIQLEDRELRQEQQRRQRERELHEQESLKQQRQKSLREEKRRNIAREEAGEFWLNDSLRKRINAKLNALLLKYLGKTKL